jgi:hypothetical protein
MKHSSRSNTLTLNFSLGYADLREVLRNVSYPTQCSTASGQQPLHAALSDRSTGPRLRQDGSLPGPLAVMRRGMNWLRNGAIIAIAYFCDSKISLPDI